MAWGGALLTARGAPFVAPMGEKASVQ